MDDDADLQTNSSSKASGVSPLADWLVRSDTPPPPYAHESVLDRHEDLTAAALLLAQQPPQVLSVEHQLDLLTITWVLKIKHRRPTEAWMPSDSLPWSLLQQVSIAEMAGVLLRDYFARVPLGSASTSLNSKKDCSESAVQLSKTLALLLETASAQLHCFESRSTAAFSTVSTSLLCAVLVSHGSVLDALSEGVRRVNMTVGAAVAALSAAVLEQLHCLGDLAFRLAAACAASSASSDWRFASEWVFPFASGVLSLLQALCQLRTCAGEPKNPGRQPLAKHSERPSKSSSATYSLSEKQIVAEARRLLDQSTDSSTWLGATVGIVKTSLRSGSVPALPISLSVLVYQLFSTAVALANAMAHVAVTQQRSDRRSITHLLDVGTSLAASAVTDVRPEVSLLSIGCVGAQYSWSVRSQPQQGALFSSALPPAETAVAVCSSIVLCLSNCVFVAVPRVVFRLRASVEAPKAAVSTFCETYLSVVQRSASLVPRRSTEFGAVIDRIGKQVAESWKTWTTTALWLAAGSPNSLPAKEVAEHFVRLGVIRSGVADSGGAIAAAALPSQRKHMETNRLMEWFRTLWQLLFRCRNDANAQCVSLTWDLLAEVLQDLGDNEDLQARCLSHLLLSVCHPTTETSRDTVQSTASSLPGWLTAPPIAPFSREELRKWDCRTVSGVLGTLTRLDTLIGTRWSEHSSSLGGTSLVVLRSMWSLLASLADGYSRIATAEVGEAATALMRRLLCILVDKVDRCDDTVHAGVIGLWRCDLFAAVLQATVYSAGDDAAVPSEEPRPAVRGNSGTTSAAGSETDLSRLLNHVRNEVGRVTLALSWLACFPSSVLGDNTEGVLGAFLRRAAYSASEAVRARCLWLLERKQLMRIVQVAVEGGASSAAAHRTVGGKTNHSKRQHGDEALFLPLFAILSRATAPSTTTFHHSSSAADGASRPLVARPRSSDPVEVDVVLAAMMYIAALGADASASDGPRAALLPEKPWEWETVVSNAAADFLLRALSDVDTASQRNKLSRCTPSDLFDSLVSWLTTSAPLLAVMSASTKTSRASCVLCLTLSSLDRTLLVLSRNPASLWPPHISPLVVPTLMRTIAPLRSLLVDAALGLAAQADFLGREHLVDLLFSTAMRVHLQRLYDLRQVAQSVTAAQRTADRREKAALWDAAQVRIGVFQQLWHAVLQGCFLLVRWRSAAVTGHGGGLKALLQRLIPLLLGSTTPSSDSSRQSAPAVSTTPTPTTLERARGAPSALPGDADFSGLSTVAALAQPLLKLSLELVSVAEDTRDKPERALRAWDAFVDAVGEEGGGSEGSESSNYPVAGLVLLSTTALTQELLAESGIVALQHYAMDERLVWSRLIRLKAMLRSALRQFKSDTILSRSVRDSLSRLTLLRKEHATELQRWLNRELPVDEIELDYGVPLLKVKPGHCRYHFGPTCASSVVDVRLRRINWISRLAFRATAQLAGRRVAYEREFLAEDTCAHELSSAPSETVTPTVPDSLRELVDRVLLESEDEDEDDNDEDGGGGCCEGSSGGPSGALKNPIASWRQLVHDVMGVSTVGAEFTRACGSSVTELIRWIVLPNDGKTLEQRGVELRRGVSHGVQSSRLALLLVFSKLCALQQTDASNVQGNVAEIGGDMCCDVVLQAFQAQQHIPTDGDDGAEQRKALLAYVALDWVKHCLIPGTREDEPKRRSILDRLLPLCGGPPSTASDMPQSPAVPHVLDLLKQLAFQLCPPKHHSALLRHVAGIALSRASQTALWTQRSLDAFALSCMVVENHAVPTAEREQWAARVLVRLVSCRAPQECLSYVLQRVEANFESWASTLSLEVALALLCLCTQTTQETPATSFLCSFIGQLLSHPTTRHRSVQVHFLINVLAAQHPLAFQYLLPHLDSAERAILSSLSEYSDVLDSIASTAAETGLACLSDLQEVVEYSVESLREVCAAAARVADGHSEVAASKPSSKQQPHDALAAPLPVLGAPSQPTVTKRAEGIETSSFAHDALDVLQELHDRFEDVVKRHVERMDHRFATQAATWLDRALWYISAATKKAVATSPSAAGATVLADPLPSVHPNDPDGYFGCAIAKCRAFISSAMQTVRLYHAKRDRGATGGPLPEELKSIGLGLRLEVGRELHEAMTATRRLIEKHVVPFFQPECSAGASAAASTTSKRSSNARSLRELFDGNVPPVLRRPLPVQLIYNQQDNMCDGEMPEWTIDVNYVGCAVSQEMPRRVAFKFVTSGGKKASRSFLLKGGRSKDHALRDYAVLVLLREAQRMQEHESRRLAPDGTASEMVHLSTTLLCTNAQRCQLKGDASAPSPLQLPTPCFSVLPFANGGGLIECLHKYEPISTIVEAWRAQQRKHDSPAADGTGSTAVAARASAAAPEAHRSRDAQSPPPLGLQPPPSQFQELLREVVDEFNDRARQQAAKARSAGLQATGQKHQPIDLGRPTPQVLKECFLRLLRLEPSTRDVVAHELFRGKDEDQPVLSDSVWVQRWQSYTLSLASGSALCYVLGIGDRHLGNILLERHAGSIAHVDFSVCFGAGLKLRFPERVPFRMTPVLMQPLGAYGCEGGFKRHGERILECVAQNEVFLTELAFALHHFVSLSHARRGVGLRTAKARPLRSQTSDVDRVMDHVGKEMEQLFSTTLAPRNAGTPWSDVRQQVLVQSKFRHISSIGRKLKGLLDEEAASEGVESNVERAILECEETLAAVRASEADNTKALQSQADTSLQLLQELERLRHEVLSIGAHESPTLLRAVALLQDLPTLLATQRLVCAAQQSGECQSLWKVGTTATSTQSGSPRAVELKSRRLLWSFSDFASSVVTREGQSAAVEELLLVERSQHRQFSARLQRAIEVARTLSKWHNDVEAPREKEMVRDIHDWLRDDALRSCNMLPALNSTSLVAGALLRDVASALITGWSEKVNGGDGCADTSASSRRPTAAAVCDVWLSTLIHVLCGSDGGCRISGGAVGGDVHVPSLDQLADTLIANVIAADLCSAADTETQHRIRQLVDGFAASGTAGLLIGIESTVPVSRQDAWQYFSPMASRDSLLRLCEVLRVVDDMATPLAASVTNCCVERTQSLLRSLAWATVTSVARRAVLPLADDSVVVCALDDWRRAVMSSFGLEPESSQKHNSAATDFLESSLRPLYDTARAAIVPGSASSLSGELAGMDTAPEVTDAIHRLMLCARRVVDTLMVERNEFRHEISSLEAQRDSLVQVRMRRLQRSLVIHDQRKLLADLVKHSISPVTLNGLSMLHRQVQVSVEALHHEIQEVLAEQVLSRISLPHAGPGAERPHGETLVQIAVRLIQQSTAWCSTTLNHVHQLIVEGYEPVAARISKVSALVLTKSATSEGKGNNPPRVERSAEPTSSRIAELDIACDVDALIRICDAVIVAVSLDLFASVRRLSVLCGAIGGSERAEVLTQKVNSWMQSCRLLGSEVAATYTDESTTDLHGGGNRAWWSSRLPPPCVALVASLLLRQREAAEASPPEHVDHLSAAAQHGDISAIVEDLRARLRSRRDAVGSRMNSLLQQSIDVDVLSAMYPGWTAWI